jgi:hypothetical protein
MYLFYCHIYLPILVKKICKHIVISSMLLIGCVMCFIANCNAQLYGNDDNQYVYWGKYVKTPIGEIRSAAWATTNTIKNGWDWSLPPFVKPAKKSNLCIARNSGLGIDKINQLPTVNFPSNPVIAHWVNWKLLEPTEGNYNFEPLISNIKLAYSKGYGSIVRIHFSATAFAPDWLVKYNIPLRIEKSKAPKVTNYEVSHPEFHKRYLLFIEALGKSGIPLMNEVKALYLGYASSSFGDEGIGPHPEKFSNANDTIQHVIERIDAWAKACKGVEDKVIMGGLSDYGTSKGFGIRRGFVEMYLYHIPDAHIGQMLDANGYLYTDESNQIVAKNVFNGEENEEYEEAWATESRGFRFGTNTSSFPYRYFTANLRLLQMRCNDLLNNNFALLPEMLAWVGVSMGKNVSDAPDVWSFLRESYIKENGGSVVKNFERWVYQRDKPGYETKPAIKVQHPIKMWMVKPNMYYDFVAREGKKIGFNIDSKWHGIKDSIAIKISYFDTHAGELFLVYHDQKKLERKALQLFGDGSLKTATFFLDRIKPNTLPYNYDFIVESSSATDKVTISLARVISLNYNKLNN